MFCYDCQITVDAKIHMSDFAQKIERFLFAKGFFSNPDKTNIFSDIFLARIKAKSDKTNVKSNLAMFVIVRHFASIVRKTNRDTEKKPYILCNLPQNTQCIIS